MKQTSRRHYPSFLHNLFPTVCNLSPGSAIFWPALLPREASLVAVSEQHTSEMLPVSVSCESDKSSGIESTLLEEGILEWLFIGLILLLVAPVTQRALTVPATAWPSSESV